MPANGKRRIPRKALAAAALAVTLALTAGACEDGGGDSGADDKQQESQAPEKELALPEGIPEALKNLDLDKWRDGGWEDWAKEDWLRDAREFVNPIIEDLWDPDRMWDAEQPPSRVDEDDVSGDQGVTDPEPAPVEAVEAATPYDESQPAAGKIFFDTPEGPMVCSGTVVADPANPGKSNLVATAGHCVHKGSDGGWWRNVIFVPSFNPEGKTVAELEAEQATEADIAPKGTFWAEEARTTDEWISEGKSQGGVGAPYDFAVMKVQPKDGGGQSLEEAVGASVPVWFDAPAVKDVGDLTATGYPAAAPYDGGRLYSCTDAPGRLSIQASQPTMYRIGCTMTAGASGGGWTASNGGEEQLVSVTSIGPLQATWLAGPRLDKEAKAVFDEVSGG
jgi:V8-like Glu-specific endopeptidase